MRTTPIQHLRSACRYRASASLSTLARILQSSAYSLQMFLIFDGGSFTNVAKSIGPRTLPCGTPDKTGTHLDVLWPSTTLCFLFDKNARIHCNNRSLRPRFLSFASSRLCGTLSNFRVFSFFFVLLGQFFFHLIKFKF